MRDERIRLLSWFDIPFDVKTVCIREFHDATYWPAQHLLSSAKHEGLIVECEKSQKIVNSPAVYDCVCILTNKGRVLCGLPLVAEPEEDSKPKQGLLFDE